MKNIIKFIVAVSLCAGCGTTSVMMNVKRPAEINLKQYDKIAIGGITDDKGKESTHAKDLTDEVTNALFQSKHFEVLDRQHLDTVLKEHKLNLSGVVDERTTADLGKMIGAAALVFGRIQQDNYEENMSKSDGWKDKEGKFHQTHYRNGTYTLSVNLKVVDMETSKILAVKTINSSRATSKSADRATPEKIDSNSLYISCVQDIKEKFMRLVAPYEITVNAEFLTDKLLPEVDQAITQFKIGEWSTGMELLQSATRKEGLEKDVLAKAYYDLGLAQMYRDQIDDAIRNMKEAMKLMPEKTIYQNAVLEAKREKENATKLHEQL